MADPLGQREALAFILYASCLDDDAFGGERNAIVLTCNFHRKCVFRRMANRLRWVGRAYKLCCIAVIDSVNTGCGFIGHPILLSHSKLFSVLAIAKGPESVVDIFASIRLLTLSAEKPFKAPR